MRFFRKKGLRARAAVREICDVEGEVVVSHATASTWFRRFNDGDTSLEIIHAPADLILWILKSYVKRLKQLQLKTLAGCHTNLEYHKAPSFVIRTNLTRSRDIAE